PNTTSCACQRSAVRPRFLSLDGHCHLASSLSRRTGLDPLTCSLPGRLHKPGAKAVVTINGRDHDPADFVTPASRAEDDRTIAECLTDWYTRSAISPYLSTTGLLDSVIY